MLTLDTPLSASPIAEFVPPQVQIAADQLRQSFGADFSIWDHDGHLLRRSSQPHGDVELQSDLVRSLTDRGSAQFIADADCVLMLALPAEFVGLQCVGVAAFATRHVDDTDDVSQAAELLGMDCVATAAWINSQAIWPAHALTSISEAVQTRLEAEVRTAQLERDIEKVADNLASTYEEISLLYSLTQNLRISSTDEELAELTLDWLFNCIPAEGLAIQFLPVTEEQAATYEARTVPKVISLGNCPLSCEQFTELIESVALTEGQPLVVNENVTSQPTWCFSTVNQLVLTPLTEGANVFGWLAAFNHRDGQEFGSVEANLLNSVGNILGIHSGNRELYRQQSEFLASVVRAMTSAIDAKDPYTCGHSDRVARVSVRLAQELGHDAETISTLYMAGLLHDVGKIGIKDSVLRKEGPLTDAEYEHIKLHPVLGYHILEDLKQLSDVLPVVLHHHEQWDGKGYPYGLSGEDIPEVARIAAVADAYDAMTSDRSYRKGMHQDRVDRILRDGAGKQWDARVIDAFFAAREDILEISRRERENLTLDVKQWLENKAQHVSQR